MAGELLDADAYTGGYNLQIAFATGKLQAAAPSAWALNPRGLHPGQFALRGGELRSRLCDPLAHVRAGAERSEIKVFAQAFFKKLAGALVPGGHRSALDRGGRREGTASHGLDLSGRQPKRNQRPGRTRP